VLNTIGNPGILLGSIGTLSVTSGEEKYMKYSFPVILRNLRSLLPTRHLIDEMKMYGDLLRDWAMF